MRACNALKGPFPHPGNQNGSCAGASGHIHLQLQQRQQPVAEMAVASRGVRMAGARMARPCVVPRPARVTSPLQRVQRCSPVRALEIDFSDPDTQIAMAGVVLGLVAGLGAPAWYINRVEKDEQRLEELRALNRANFEATGEYMNDEEIAKMRKPKWTDRREWQDDD